MGPCADMGYIENPCWFVLHVLLLCLVLVTLCIRLVICIDIVCMMMH